MYCTEYREARLLPGQAGNELQSPTTWMLISCSPTLKPASHPLSPDLTNMGNNTWLDNHIPSLSCYCKYQSQTKQAVFNWVTLIAFGLYNSGLRIKLCIIVLHNSGVQVLLSVNVLHLTIISALNSGW